MKKPLFYYEPKLVPVMDGDGNIIAYQNPPALPLPIHESAKLRVKTAPAELGLHASPDNVGGFRATLDTINANRNLRGSAVAPIGCDDLSVMEETTKRIQKVKDARK